MYEQTLQQNLLMDCPNKQLQAITSPTKTKKKHQRQHQKENHTKDKHAVQDKQLAFGLKQLFFLINIWVKTI